MRITVMLKDGGRLSYEEAFTSHIADDSLAVTTSRSYGKVSLSQIIRVDFGDNPNYSKDLPAEEQEDEAPLPKVKGSPRKSKAAKK